MVERGTTSPCAARIGSVLCAAAALLAGATAGAQELGPLTRMTAASRFAGCTADRVAQQDGDNYPATEIEPWVDANPTDPRNLIAVWQQDRWSNGGARGNAAGFSWDGGRTWRTVVPRGVSRCNGGAYLRASDPWVSFSPDGAAYFMSLVFDPDPPPAQPGGLSPFGRNAMIVNRSTDGGRTWGTPITLRRDPQGQALNDKNSITADPTDARFAYAVWDRLVNFELLPDRRGGGNRGARLRSLFLQEGAAAGAKAAQIFFEGPALLARTTNGGRSWEPAKVIYDPGGNAQTIGNQVVVLPSGVVVNFFSETFADGFALSLVRSFDKGRTFGRPSRVAAIASSPTGTLTPDEERAVRDGAILFDVAVDARNGRLYAVWQDTWFRGVDEVAFSQSFDGGYTWTRPVRINKTPASRNPLLQQAFITSVEVGAGGTLVVTYYDFRRDNRVEELADHWAILCSARCDRAASWGDERRLTTFPTDMLDAPLAGGLFLGDYVGLVAAGDDVQAVFSLVTRPDVTNLYARPIDLGTRALAGTP